MKKIDTDANVFLRGAIDALFKSERRDIQSYSNFNIKSFRTFFPPWKGTARPIQYFVDHKLDDEKEEKIGEHKKHFLENSFSEPTYICITGPQEKDPVMIIDGNHRAIGLLRALEEHSGILSRVHIRLIMLTGERMTDIEEYRMLLNKKS